MKKRIYIIAAVFAILTSCTETIDYKGHDTEPMLVINSIANAGDTVKVRVSHSTFFLDSRNEGSFLTDADVTISIDGDSRQAMFDHAENVYRDSRTIHSGDKLTISAFHPSYGTATATDVVPDSIDLTISERRNVFIAPSDSSYWFSGSISSLTDSVWSITVRFPESNPDSVRYYRLSIYPYMKWNFDSIETDTLVYGDSNMKENLYYSIPFQAYLLTGGDNSTDNLEDMFTDAVTYDSGINEFVFSNERIGDNNGITFDVCLTRPHPASWYYGYNEDYDAIYNKTFSGNVTYCFDIALESMSETCYYYYRSAQEFDNSSWAILDEPVTIIHNVKGGLGIVAARSTFRTTLTMTRHY